MSLLDNIHAALENVPADKREQNATKGWIKHAFRRLERTHRRRLSNTGTIGMPLTIPSADVDLSIFRKADNLAKAKK